MRKPRTPMAKFKALAPRISLDGDVAWILDDQINRAMQVNTYPDERDAQVMDRLTAVKAAKVLQRRLRSEEWILKNAK
jgi:hypothetical protein